MAVGTVPYDDEEELPEEESPAAEFDNPSISEPTVMSPIGNIPASTPGLGGTAAEPGTPPAADVPPTTDLTPGANGPSPPVGPAVAGAPAAASSPAAVGALPPPAPPPGAPPVDPIAAVGPRPARPAPTGDYGTDMANNAKYEQQLEDWHLKRTEAAAGVQADIRKKQAADTLAAEQVAQKKRDEETARAQAEIADRRAQVQSHIDERARAIGDIENGKYKDQTTGGKIRSVLAQVLGAFGAGWSAAGGHPTGNLGQQAIDNLMQREYQHAQDKVTNANEAIQQARYGYKDAEDNHRAALNDIDADMAAKYKLIANTAADEMAKRGVAPEDIQTNEFVAGSLQKSAQYADQITIREMDAQRKAEALAEKKNLDVSTIGRNNAQADAAEALAGFRNRRNANAGKTGTGGLSKSAQKAQDKEIKDIEHAGDKASSVVKGSARSPGVRLAYESAVAVSNELKQAAASGDPDRMKIAVLHAQEQSTRFLTNAAPTQQTFEIQHQLASTAEELEAKFGGWTGQPTEARSYVQRMAKNIDAIAKQRKEVLDAEHEDWKARAGSIVKTDEGRRRAAGIEESLFGKSVPKKTQQMGGATYEFGDDGNWHKVK